MSRRGLVAFVCAWVTLGSLVSICAQTQSLADVARKEEERRKTIAKPAKVYTNQDLRPVPAPSQQAAAPAADAKPDEKAPAKDAAKDPAATDAAKEPVKDKAYWADKLKALREQLARDETYAEALQSRINALTTDFVNRDDPAQKSVIERDRLKALAELDRLKQAIPTDKKAIDSLLEEARHAGVPPGWLR